MKQVETEDTELFQQYSEGAETVKIDPKYPDVYRIEREEYEITEFMGREIVYQERSVDGSSKVLIPGYLIEEEHYPQDPEAFEVNREEKAIEVSPVANEDTEDVEKWLRNIGIEGRFEFW